jgi:hypothetical protein
VRWELQKRLSIEYCHLMRFTGYSLRWLGLWWRPRGQPPRIPPRPWVGEPLEAKPDATARRPSRIRITTTAMLI